MKYGELTLGQMEVIVNKLGGMEGVKRFLAGELNVVAAAVKKLLALVTTAEVTSNESFVVAEKFREGETTDGVKIAWVGGNFKQHLLGKTETSVAPATLRIYKLKEDSFDAPVLAELGDTAETTLAHFWELLKKQGRGQKGKLLVNGYANIAYIRDASGTRWAVSAYWCAGLDGWFVEAYPVTDPIRWLADRPVISR